MKTMRFVAALVAISFVFVTPYSWAKDNPGIAPIQSHPHGNSYSEWAAEWWQWALEIPASINPVTDDTGERCNVNQSGHVWFLAGLLFDGSVTRGCTIPAGTALFFPIANIAYGAFLTDPPETKTEDFIRSQVTCVEDSAISVEIDGVPIVNPKQFLEQSTIFSVVLPEDNVFGLDETIVPELTLDPSVDEGYYLFLNPLPPGRHTIHFRATGGCFEFGIEVTYHLTVTRGR